MDEVIREIEAALVGHWSLLGHWPKGALVEERGTLRYETPIPQLPYNGVIRTVIADDQPDDVISSVLESYRQRGASCLWWEHPSAQPAGLGAILERHGLSLAEKATGMSIDAERADPPAQRKGDVRYEEVLDDAGMRAYSELIVDYWEVPAESRSLVRELNRYWVPERAPVHRWVAFDANGRAIGKVLLSLAAREGVAAIYGMSVRPEARGQGVASHLTDIVLWRARELGCRRVVLHSSEMAVGVYLRAGFERKCELTVYANAQLWASRRH